MGRFYCLPRKNVLPPEEKITATRHRKNSGFANFDIFVWDEIVGRFSLRVVVLLCHAELVSASHREPLLIQSSVRS